MNTHAAVSRAGSLALLGALALAAAGCVEQATKPEASAAPPEIVFPEPPDPARFAFERSLFSTANLKLEDDTERLRRMLTGEATTGRGFGKPFDVVACRGRIYVSDTAERSVLAFDVPGRRFFEIGVEEPGALSQPLGLNVDDRCNLYVADGTRREVVIFDADGRFQAAIGGREEFHRLSHVAVTPDGSRIYAVDTGGIDTDEHRVRVYDPRTGEHRFDFGRRGTEPGEFNLPRDIEVGRDGLVYVIDGANFRVQVFDADGRFVRTFGRVGRQTGQFSRPKGIAVDPQGRVYVSDAAFGNFQIFTPEGQLLLFVGKRGSKPEPATYMLPAGIDVDEDGRVYMVDQFFAKVDIYRPVTLARTEGYLGVWDAEIGKGS